MPITKAELARQLEELRGQLTVSERRADEQSLEVEELKLEVLQTWDPASKSKAGKGSSDLRGGSPKEVDSSSVADKDKSPAF